MSAAKIVAPLHQPPTRPINAKLSEPLVDVEYCWVYQGRTYRMLVRRGYPFDGASIPRVAWTALGLAPHGVMDGPALPHDRGYQDRGVFPSGEYQYLDTKSGIWVDAPPMKRAHADALLEALCEHFRVGNVVQIQLVWAAVRAFGWIAWLRDDRTRKKLLIEQKSPADIIGA